MPEILQHDPLLAPFSSDLYDIFHDCVSYMRILLKDASQFHSQLCQIHQEQKQLGQKDVRGLLPNRLTESCRVVHIYFLCVASFAHCTLTLSVIDGDICQPIKIREDSSKLWSKGVHGLTQTLSFSLDTLLLSLLTTTSDARLLCQKLHKHGLEPNRNHSLKSNVSREGLSLRKAIQQVLLLPHISITSLSTAKHCFFHSVCFDASILLAQFVSQCVLHVLCDTPTLQVVVSGRKRFMKNASRHSNLPLLQFKTQSVAKLLQLQPGAEAQSHFSDCSNESQKVDLPEIGKPSSVDCLSFVQVLPVHDNEFHIFNNLAIPLLSAAQRVEEEQEEYESKQLAADIEQQQQQDVKHRKNASKPAISKEEFQSSLHSRISPSRICRAKSKTMDLLPSIKNNNAKNDHASMHNAAASKPKSGSKSWQRKISHFLSLKKSFRELFLFFDCLSVTNLGENISSELEENDDHNNLHSSVLPFVLNASDAVMDPLNQDIMEFVRQWQVSIFSTDYRPQLLQNPLSPWPLQKPSTVANLLNGKQQIIHCSKRSLTEQVRHYEALCLHLCQCPDTNNLVPIPFGSTTVSYRSRVADPLQLVCHFLQCIWEYLWQMCRADNGLCRTPEQQLRQLQQQLRQMSHYPLSPEMSQSLRQPLLTQHSSGQGSSSIDRSKTSIKQSKNKKATKATSTKPTEKADKRDFELSKSFRDASCSVATLPVLTNVNVAQKSKTAKKVHQEDLGARLAKAAQIAHIEAKTHTLEQITCSRNAVGVDRSNSNESVKSDSLFGHIQQYFKRSKVVNDGTIGCEDEDDNESVDDEIRELNRKYGDLASLSSECEDSDYEMDFCMGQRGLQKREKRVISERADANFQPAIQQSNSRNKHLAMQSVIWFTCSSQRYDTRTDTRKKLSAKDESSKSEKKESGKSRSANDKRQRQLDSAEAAANKQSGDWIKQMIQQHIASQINDSDILAEGEEDHPLRGLPLPLTLSQGYANLLLGQKHVESEKELENMQQREEEQARIVTENKVHRQRQLQLQRQQQLEELQAAQLVQQEYDGRRLQLKQQQQQKEMELKEAKRARQETERIRIVDLQNMKRFQEVQKQHRQDEELQMQQLLISFVTNAKEHEEILRRLREEDSMRNEEKKRSIIEARNEAERNKKLQEKTSKQSKWKRDIAMTEHRVRRGQFQWHHGVFGFYDQVR